MGLPQKDSQIVLPGSIISLDYFFLLLRFNFLKKRNIEIYRYKICIYYNLCNMYWAIYSTLVEGWTPICVMWSEDDGGWSPARWSDGGDATRAAERDKKRFLILICTYLSMCVCVKMKENVLHSFFSYFLISLSFDLLFVAPHTNKWKEVSTWEMMCLAREKVDRSEEDRFGWWKWVQ